MIATHPELVHETDKIISTACLISHDEYRRDSDQHFLRNKNNHFYVKQDYRRCIKTNPVDPMTREKLVQKEVNSESMPPFFSSWHYAIQAGMNEIFTFAKSRVSDFATLLLFSLHCENFAALEQLIPLFDSSLSDHEKAIQRAVFICVEKNLHTILAKLLPYYSKYIKRRSVNFDETILDIAIRKQSYRSVPVLLANGAR
ncbi:hypothetical protein MMH89_01020 [Candidatus Comchoanobacter bicostacola]|uniref:Uncharacterized protein n=1 Tax=Candidatus Comchoanobacter bicostacola TaxID=2919598 RepID=A0ABY5DLD0_9GAMM|nr:hypothetical protein [Candidatus Comchoanobacter bicostacola]UTC24737.1 hypothetical protein MMH89_01020 [Candidatus Comchoanobacter bicostacola]